MPKRFGAALHVVAGFPQPVAEAAVASLRKSSEFPRANYVQAASKRNGLIYSQESVRELLRVTWDAVCRGDGDGPIDPGRIVLHYVPDSTSSVLLDGFGLSCFPIPIEIRPEKLEIVRKNASVAAAHLKGVIAKELPQGIRIAETEISERHRKTALLLPARNFLERSTGDPIGGWLRRLADGSEDWETVAARLSLFRLTHDDLPRTRVRKIRAHVDGRDLCFVPAPPNEMHGRVREGNLGEEISSLRLLLNAKYRFGVPIVSDGFHYDVQVKGGGSLSTFSFECAENGEVTTRGPHVNIYPNDFVRP